MRSHDTTFKQKIKRNVVMYFEPVTWVWEIIKLAFKRN